MLSEGCDDMRQKRIYRKERLEAAQSVYAEICTGLKEAIDNRSRHRHKGSLEVYWLPHELFCAQYDAVYMIKHATTEVELGTSDDGIEGRVKKHALDLYRQLTTTLQTAAYYGDILRGYSTTQPSDADLESSTASITPNMCAERPYEKATMPQIVQQRCMVYRMSLETLMQKYLQRAYDALKEAERTLAPLLET